MKNRRENRRETHINGNCTEKKKKEYQQTHNNTELTKKRTQDKETHRHSPLNFSKYERISNPPSSIYSPCCCSLCNNEREENVRSVVVGVYVSVSVVDADVDTDADVVGVVVYEVKVEVSCC